MASAKGLKWELGRQNRGRPCSCHWLGSQGAERRGVRPKAPPLAEVVLGMCGEGTRAGTSVGTAHAESSRLLEGQPPLPEQSQLLRGLAMSWFPCLMTNVFHPHLIMQQTPVKLPPSGPTPWVG